MSKTIDTPVADQNSPVYYAEECGLALMKHSQTGKKFCVEKEIWHDVVSNVQSGWQPWAKHSGTRGK